MAKGRRSKGSPHSGGDQLRGEGLCVTSWGCRVRNRNSNPRTIAMAAIRHGRPTRKLHDITQPTPVSSMSPLPLD